MEPFEPPPTNDLSRHRRKVTQEERATIIVMAAKGYTAQEISTAVHRTPDAVISLLRNFGVRSYHLRKAYAKYPDRPMTKGYEFTEGVRA
jgi:hypothetical protein